MVNMLQVLEGAAYVGFIAGAIFAVMELRDIKKDRRIDLWLRIGEVTTTREYVEANCKIWRAKGITAQELEDEFSLVDLTLVADYYETISNLATEGHIEARALVDFLPFAGFWKKIRPWVIAVRSETGEPDLYDDIEKLARMQESSRGSEYSTGTEMPSS